MAAIGYYPGCSLRGTASEYDHSLRAVAQRLQVELREVPEWVCCGATSAHAIDHHAALALASDTLAKARTAGIDRILAPCAMCFQRLAVAHKALGDDPVLAARMTAALGESADLGIERVTAVNLLDWLASVGDEMIRACVARPLRGLKVACYYGCLLLRPPKVTGAAEAEAPRTMEHIVELLGAQTVRWPMATECCGASFALSRKVVVLRQGLRIYQTARDAGADVLCLACPMCHANLDMREAEFAGGVRDLPVVYLTQLIGIAMGIADDALGLRSHFVPVQPALAKIGNVEE